LNGIGNSALSVRKENIVRLKRQGWSIDEIAQALKISKEKIESIVTEG